MMAVATLKVCQATGRWQNVAVGRVAPRCTEPLGSMALDQEAIRTERVAAIFLLKQKFEAQK